MNWLDNALGAHSNAVLLRARRAEILAANLANSDTPGYKAKDVDFKQVYNQMQEGSLVAPAGPDGQQPSLSDQVAFATYDRVPTQAPVEGNTVDRETEQAAFSSNSVRYLASLRFLNGSIKTLRLAIRGE